MRLIIILLAVMAMTTGAMDMALGVAGQTNVGAMLPKDAIDPVIDSQVRFWGAIWLGLGIIQLMCLRHIPDYLPILRLTLACLILGGVGRAASCLFVGFPGTSTGQGFVVLALVIELGLAPLLLFFAPPVLTRQAAGHVE